MRSVLEVCVDSTASALAVLSTHTSRTERISIPPFLPGFEPGILVYSTTFFRFIKPCGSKKLRPGSYPCRSLCCFFRSDPAP